MKQVKTKLHSIDKIEKTVNAINAKVSDLETKMKTLDTQVTETELSSEGELTLLWDCGGRGKEDCSKLLRDVIRDVLHIPNVKEIMFDMVHRVGQRSATTSTMTGRKSGIRRLHVLMNLMR